MPLFRLTSLSKRQAATRQQGVGFTASAGRPRLAAQIGMCRHADSVGFDRLNGLARSRSLAGGKLRLQRWQPDDEVFPLARFCDRAVARSRSPTRVIDRIVARTLLTAFDSKSRQKGLLGRDSLPEGSALIIAPSQAIHTFSMRFAIDVAFVAKDGRVLKVRQAVPPRRIAVAWRAFAVIELPAGALEASDTRPGDLLQVTRI